MKKSNKRKKKWGVFALLLAFLCLFFTGCEKKISYETHDFFLKNQRGTYTYGELVIPAADGSCPLVFLAHGFKGTRNSGGAQELSQRLAEAGIAALRIDFNSYMEADRGRGQTNAYTLTDMINDATMSIDYVTENFNIDMERIGIHGRSMGGRVAMIMGNENKGNFEFKAMSLVAPAGNESAMIYYMGGESRWAEMKAIAASRGYCEKQGLKLSPDWFTDFEKYNPSKTGHRFGNRPVLVFYNTLDHVVLPETSKECAEGYQNVELVQVTTEDGHGYEMGVAQSSLKEDIMDKIVGFFVENL